MKLVYEVRVRITGDPAVDLKPGMPGRRAVPPSRQQPGDWRCDRCTASRSRRVRRYACPSCVHGTDAALRRAPRPGRAVASTSRPGELFGLVGPDGAGKTTTLRMLAGVLRPTAGDALVGGPAWRATRRGEAPHRLHVAALRAVQDLTVRENIDFYADLYGVPARMRAGAAGAAVRRSRTWGRSRSGWRASSPAG